VLLLLLTDLALIFGFFKWDSNHAEYSCFLIYDNKWR
jgi:hypothetical protein